MGSAKARTQPRTEKAAVAGKAALDPELDESSASDDSASDDEVASPPATEKSNPRSAKPSGSGRKPRQHEAAPSSVLYLGHLPRHFQEPEILKFAKQFGPVQHVRLSRSRRTGGTRGYAFVQMAEPEVAVITAGALSGYLLDGKRLVCHVVPPDRIHKNMVRTFAKPKAKQPRRERSLEHVRAVSKRLLQRQALLKRKLQDAGIDYEFEGYTANAPAATTKAATTTKKAKTTPAQKAPRKDSVDAEESADLPRRGSRRRQESIGSEASASKAQPPRRNRTGSVDADQARTRKDSLASVESAGSAPPVRKAPESERKAPTKSVASRRSRRKSA